MEGIKKEDFDKAMKNLKGLEIYIYHSIGSCDQLEGICPLCLQDLDTRISQIKRKRMKRDTQKNTQKPSSKIEKAKVKGIEKAKVKGG